MYALIAVPLVAGLAVLLSGGRWRLFDERGGIRLSSIVLLPVMVLFVHGFTGGGMIAWQVPVAEAIGVGLVMRLAFAAAERRLRPKVAAVGGAACMAFAWAAGLQLNDLLDRATPTVTPVQVVARYQTGDSRHRNYGLNLSPWGPYGNTHPYKVTKELYQKVKVGDTVCVYRHPGALGWPYISLAKCPPSDAQT